MGQDDLTDRKLIIVCGTLEAGGAERIISILSAFFVDYFESVKIFTWRDAPVFYKFDKRVTIVSIPQVSGKRKLVTRMMWFRKHVKENHPDVVLSFLAPFNMLTVLSLIGSGVPVFLADRNDPRYSCPNIFWRKIRNFFYGKANGLCVQTQNNKDYFAKHIRRKTVIIHNPAFLKPDQIGLALKTPKEKIIVSVGRLIPQKNFKLLIRAFADVIRIYSDYHLVIYGEGPQRVELENEIEKLHLTGIVELPGTQEDVHAQLLNAELFVMSSDYEGMANALIEAMCLGLPCISTKVSGATDLIEDRINGCLVDIGDQNAMVQTMMDLLHDKDQAYKIANQAVLLNEKLNIHSVVTQWMEFIRNS